MGYQSRAAAAGALCAHTRGHVKLTSAGQTRDVWDMCTYIGVSEGWLAARIKVCWPQSVVKSTNQQVLFHICGDVAVEPLLAEAGTPSGFS